MSGRQPSFIADFFAVDGNSREIGRPSALEDVGGSYHHFSIFLDLQIMPDVQLNIAAIENPLVVSLREGVLNTWLDTTASETTPKQLSWNTILGHRDLHI